jgi:tungstate transport system permease protein
MLDLLFDPEVLGIIGRTLRMTLTSTTISAVLGIPLGLLLERVRFPGKRFVVGLNRTLMATPPVVAGLVIYMLLRRTGPLGGLGLLFTFNAMVIVQVVLITPIICGMVHTAAARHGDRIRAFAHTMGASKFQTQILIIRELGNEMFFAVVTGFGRAMSEVGAIIMVGGNIRFATRTMTTSIALDVRRGQFEEGIIFGLVLMSIAFIIQMTADFLRKRGQRLDENF